MPPPNPKLGKEYEVIGGDTLRVVRTQVDLPNADDDARLAILLEIQADSDGARTEIAQAKGLTLAEYDTQLQDEIWDLRERIDYIDVHPTVSKSRTVVDGVWLRPEAVESFCGEDAGDPAVDSINGINSDFWRHSTNEAHEIVYRIRDSHPKKVSRIRFRYNSTEPAREQLDQMTVRAAKNLPKIDDPENELETALDITWPTGQGSTWVEVTLTKKKPKARYIKLTGFGSANANNQIQIREFEVYCEPRITGDNDPEE